MLLEAAFAVSRVKMVLWCEVTFPTLGSTQLTCKTEIRTSGKSNLATKLDPYVLQLLKAYNYYQSRSVSTDLHSSSFSLFMTCNKFTVLYIQCAASLLHV